MQAALKWQSAMEGNGVCCIVIFVIVAAAAIGFTMLHFGRECNDAQLREKHRNGTCKHIHSDDSATALTVIGVILVFPFHICVLLCLCYFGCPALGETCSSNTVEPSGGGGGFVIGMIGFSDDWLHSVFHEPEPRLNLWPFVTHCSLSVLSLAKNAIVKKLYQ